MLFSPATRYAILALAYLAGQETSKPLSVSHIAEQTNVPEKFLAKILITLKQHELLRSTKGPGGGYVIRNQTDEISLSQIMEAIEGPRWSKRCVLGLDRCLDEVPCPLHNEWTRFRQDIHEKIHTVTIADLAERLREKQAYLKN